MHVPGLFNPLATSVDLTEGSLLLVAMKLTLYLNWVLLLLNLLPAYPFDGGPMLRALLWPALGRRSARIWTSRIAMGLALAFCVWGGFTLAQDFDARVAPHIPLFMLGLMLFFSARQDLLTGQPNEQLDDQAGYQLDSDGLDLLEAMWTGEDDESGVLVEHQPHRQQGRRRDFDAVEDARVDDILARLHNSSLDSLSQEEVDILQRASERYRQRKGGYEAHRSPAERHD
jgi:hypothetical protein